MAALSNRGNGEGARTGSASTRPAAWGNGTAAAGTATMAAAIEAATSSTDASDSSARFRWCGTVAAPVTAPERLPRRRPPAATGAGGR
jgi:hypothetical protein